MKLRKYQEKALAECLTAYKKEKCFRYNMTTGTGKTYLAIATAQKVAKDRMVVIAVHSNLLKDQFEKEVGRKLENYIVVTHQALVNMHIKCYMLIVDEVHQGGQTEDGNYDKIIKQLKPKKILSLSATDLKVDEKLFGKKKFVYGLEEAQHILNPCDIITIDTGLTQKLSNNDTIEAEALNELYDMADEKGVDIKCKESTLALAKGGVKAAIKVYKKHEEGNQALFFVPSIEIADWIYKTKQFKNVASHCVTHSHAHHIDFNPIEEFKNKEFNILVCVRRAQEGFDYPELECVFDCSPSFSNGGRIFKQRIGRILRKKKGKDTSRYYLINRLNKYTDYLDIHDSTRACVEESVRNDLRDNQYSSNEIFVPKGDEHDNINKSSLFVKKSNNHIYGKKRNLFDMLGRSQDPEGKKKRLISMAENGEGRPNTGDYLYRAFKRYTNKNCEGYDSVFVESIKSVNKSWLRNISGKDTSLAKKEEIISIAKNGGSLVPRTKLMGSYHNYMRKRSKSFDREFRDTIERLRPDWILRTNYRTDEINKKLLEYAKMGGARPKSDTKIYQCMIRKTRKNYKQYDKEFHEKLKKIAPKDWNIK